MHRETDRLYPLIDGPAMHGVLRPEKYPPAHVLEVLESHVAELGQPMEG